MLYLDYSATTPLREEVKREMEPFFSEEFANPNSPHDAGLRAHSAVEEARERIGHALGTASRRIIFTSGGTEANNLAVLGAARARKSRGSLVLTTAIEHKSILAPVAALRREGFQMGLIPVDKQGLIEKKTLSDLITKETILACIGHANNEIGTVQPIAELAELAHRRGTLLHCDAVQSLGKLPVNVKQLGADLLSISGHKIYGPKGIGLLYVGPGVRLEPLVYGGGQERGVRPGTLNVPAIMGLAKAVELAVDEQTEETIRLSALRDELIRRVLEITGVYLNGPSEKRLPNHVNFGVKGIEGQLIAAELSKREIAVSAVSACSSASREPSHVLLALGQETWQALEGFRITLGRDTTRSDILQLLFQLNEIIKELQLRFSD